MHAILRYLAARPETRPFWLAYRVAGHPAHLLACADWMDEHDQPELAAVIRAAFTPKGD